MYVTLFQLRERLARFEALMISKYGKEYTRRYLTTERDQHNKLFNAVASKRASLYAQYQEPYTGPDADVVGVTVSDLLSSSRSSSK